MLPLFGVDSFHANNCAVAFAALHAALASGNGRKPESLQMDFLAHTTTDFEFSAQSTAISALTLPQGTAAGAPSSTSTRTLTPIARLRAGPMGTRFAPEPPRVRSTSNVSSDYEGSHYVLFEATTGTGRSAELNCLSCKKTHARHGRGNQWY